jgi:hypothetical protein
MTMYEAWLMLNIVWEILLTAWPLTLALLLLVAGLGLAALLARGAAWRAAWPVALAGAAIVGVLKYWVDWMALAGLAGGFATLAAALLWPLMALLKRQPI